MPSDGGEWVALLRVDGQRGAHWYDALPLCQRAGPGFPFSRRNPGSAHTLVLSEALSSGIPPWSVEPAYLRRTG